MRRFIPYVLSLCSIACAPESFEEYSARYNREQAAIYEQSTGSNIEAKLQPDLHFGIVVVDTQTEFINKINSEERLQLISQEKRVLEAAKTYNIPLLVFEMDNFGETLPTLERLVEQVPRHTTFRKYRDNGFEIYGTIQKPNAEIFPDDWLREQGVDTLYFMGMNGNACVYATANSAQDFLGFQIATSNDVIATADENSQTGNCAFDSCDEAKSGLTFFLEKGILSRDSQAFLEYFSERKKGTLNK